MARILSQQTQKVLYDCLVWFSRGRFVEEDSFDIYEDMVTAYEGSTKKKLIREDRTELENFLLWMDGGDRLYRIGPDNPYGDNIQFNANDYTSTDDKGRVELCAADMVKYYIEELE